MGEAALKLHEPAPAFADDERDALAALGHQAAMKMLQREWGSWRWDTVFTEERRRAEYRRVLGLVG